MATAPSNIKLHRKSRALSFDYAAGEHYELSCEYLRVYSPSAEVRGHGQGQEVLQTGKKYVGINAIEPVGNYAIKLVFDDGHDSGIYSWQYLLELCEHQAQYWDDYLQRLKQASASREPSTIPITQL